MRGRRGVDHLQQLEPGTTVAEEPDAAAQEQRRDVDPQLVDEARVQVLLYDVRAAGELDVSFAGRFTRLFESGLRCRR